MAEKSIHIKILAMDRGWPQSHQTQLELIIQRPLLNESNSNGHLENKNIIGREMLQSTCQLENRHAPEFLTEENSIIGQIDQTVPIGTVSRKL